MDALIKKMRAFLHSREGLTVIGYAVFLALIIFIYVAIKTVAGL